MSVYLCSIMDTGSYQTILCSSIFKALIFNLQPFTVYVNMHNSELRKMLAMTNLRFKRFSFFMVHLIRDVLGLQFNVPFRVRFSVVYIIYSHKYSFLSGTKIIQNRVFRDYESETCTFTRSQGVRLKARIELLFSLCIGTQQGNRL